MSTAAALYWPDLYAGNVVVNPPRNGMDRYTGAVLQGWKHVEQSLEFIFSTPFHTRVLRRWVGSFVPPLLGRNITTPTVTRFYWSIVSAIDLWEPDYRITSISFMTDIPGVPISTSTAEQLIRTGRALFAQTGVYYPRGHLGDYTPAELPNNYYRPLSALQIEQLAQLTSG